MQASVRTPLRLTQTCVLTGPISAVQLLGNASHAGRFTRLVPGIERWSAETDSMNGWSKFSTEGIATLFSAKIFIELLLGLKTDFPLPLNQLSQATSIPADSYLEKNHYN